MEPLKRQTKEQDERYTLMLIPHRGQEPKSISFDVKAVKKVGIVCLAACTLLVGFLGHAGYVVYKAHKEQNELNAYRADKAAQEQKLTKLQADTEKMQKDMAELYALETEVRQALGKESPQPSRSGIDRSQHLGKGGPTNVDLQMIDVYAAQNKNLQIELAAKKANLSALLSDLREQNAYNAAMPTQWPTDGGEITSDYGYRSNPFGGGGGDWHPGVDIANYYGAPVYASGTGVVVEAQWYGGYGRYIKIDHGYGIETAYAHLAEISASPGEHVEKGEVIGYVGSSGYSTGPHLHYEVLIGGETRNPMGYF